MSSHLAIWLAGLLVTSVFSISASIAFADGQRSKTDGKSPTTSPSPNPDLPPKVVVSTVIDALGKNDANDSGIKTTWNFASPGNKDQTGPLDRFIPMVKSEAYSPMLNHKSAEVRELAANDEHAAELAIITDAKGDKAYYIFQLSKQTDGNVQDCWMTDGVVRVEPANVTQPPARQPDQKPPGGQTPV